MGRLAQGLVAPPYGSAYLGLFGSRPGTASDHFVVELDDGVSARQSGRARPTARIYSLNRTTAWGSST